MDTRKGFRSLFALKLMLLIIATVVLAGCAPRLVLNPGLPDVVLSVPSSSSTQTISAPHGNADTHFVQPDDYFFNEESLDDYGWVYVKLGKIVTAPTPETKNQAQFMNASTGKQEWAKWWAKTRIATKADLALGTEVICFDSNNNGEVYMPPENNQTARTDSWFLARITDTSELFKGYVMVTDGYKVHFSNLRVIVK